MSDKQEVAKPNKGWMRYVLVASLGLNVLIIGLVGGAFLRGGPMDHIRTERDVSVLGLRAYYRALDDSGQGELLQAIKANRPRIKAGRAEFRAHLEALANALSAEPYDPVAMASVLQGQAGNVAENIGLGHQLLLDQIATLSPENRKSMAQRLLKPPRRSGPDTKRRN